MTNSGYTCDVACLICGRLDCAGFGASGRREFFEGGIDTRWAKALVSIDARRIQRSAANGLAPVDEGLQGLLTVTLRQEAVLVLNGLLDRMFQATLMQVHRPPVLPLGDCQRRIEEFPHSVPPSGWP